MVVIATRVSRENASVQRLMGQGVEYRIRRGQFVLDEHLDRVVPERWIYFYVLGLVSGYIAPDTGVIGVTLALIPVVMDIVDAGLPATWGSLMLAELYRDLHKIVYQGGGQQGRSIGFPTLLQV